MSDADGKVIDVVGEGWVMCQRQNVAGDIFYMNMKTNEVSLDPPAHNSPPAPPLPQGTLTRPRSVHSTMRVAPVATEQPAAVLAEYGDWAICEDVQGEFYYHWPTNQSYDNPPAELLQLCEEKDREDQVRQAYDLASSAVRQYHVEQPSHSPSVCMSQAWAGQMYRSSDYVSTAVSSVSAYRSSDYVREEVKQPSVIRVVQQAAYVPQQNVKYMQQVAYSPQYAQPVYQYANSNRRIVVH